MATTTKCWSWGTVSFQWGSVREVAAYTPQDARFVGFALR